MLIAITVKGMSDNKVGQFCLPTKICRLSCKNRFCQISVTVVIVYGGRWIFILVIYFVCYSMMFIFVHYMQK